MAFLRLESRLAIGVACAIACALGGDARAQEVVTFSDEAAIGSDAAGPIVLGHAADTHQYELGAYSTYIMAPIRGSTNPFGLGFGGRAGLLFSHVYFGGNAAAFLGDTDVNTSETAVLFGGEVGYDFTGRVGDGWLSLRPGVGVGDMIVTRTDPSLLGSSSTSKTSTANLGKPDVVTQATSQAPSSGSGSGSSGGSGVGGGGSGASLPTPGMGSGPNVGPSRTSSSSGASDKISVSNVYVQPGVTLRYSLGPMFAGANANVLVVPGLSYGGYQTTWVSPGVEAQLGLRW